MNILVSRLRFLGDIILTTPLLNGLRQAYPDAKITYLAEEPYIRILDHHPDVDTHLGFVRGNKAQEWDTIRHLITRRFDIAIDLFGNPRSALLTYLSSAKTRIGGDFRIRRHFYTHPVSSPDTQTSSIDFHLQYLQPLQIEFERRDPYLAVSDEERQWAKSYLYQKGISLEKRIIGIHPGATWPAKRWYPQRFAELADKLKEWGHQVIFTMGPNEQSLINKVFTHTVARFAQPELLTLRHLTALISLCCVYVSNDCGPMHIGPAVNTSTVGIFGPGEPHIWFPYSREKGHQLVYHRVDCSQCHQDFCEKLDCMKAISVQKVLDKISFALNTGKNS